MYRELIVEAFIPLYEKEKAKEFDYLQKKALHDFGVSNVTSIQENWIDAGNVYAITIRSEDGKMIAGTRIEVLESNSQLPLEAAIAHKSPCVIENIQKKKHEIAELCGAWIQKEDRKEGLCELLVRSAFILATQLELKSVVILTSQYTRPIIEYFGFQLLNNSQGVHEYIYPDERYISTLMHTDLASFEKMNKLERNKISELEEKPNQIVLEHLGDVNIKIHYNLSLKSIRSIKNPALQNDRSFHT